MFSIKILMTVMIFNITGLLCLTFHSNLQRKFRTTLDFEHKKKKTITMGVLKLLKGRN